VKNSQSLGWSVSAKRARQSLIADLMASALSRPGLLSLAAGFTDNAVLPVDIVKQAVANMPTGECLQYGSNQGRPKLREALAAHLSGLNGEREGSVAAENVVMTNGSQQSLYLLTQTLCNEGDIVLVEAPTYCVIFDIFIGLGINVLPLPMSPDGQVDTEATATMLEAMRLADMLPRIKMAYFITYFSNPAALSMSLGVKRMLGQIFARYVPKMLVVEDTAYRELYYERPSAAPTCMSLPEWEGQPLVVTGSFSKCFSPGIRLGYFATKNAELIDKVLRIKAQQDFGSANLSQWIAEYALTKNLFAPFVAGLRGHYQAKARVLNDALNEGGLRALGWDWTQPEGGLLLWLHGPEGLDTGGNGAFCKACLDANVLYVPGEVSYVDTPDSPKNNVRLAIGSLKSDDLREAARRFAKAASSINA
jgi:2-aminoadipate transaminase